MGFGWMSAKSESPSGHGQQKGIAEVVDFIEARL
jgi:hypothetical protein